MDGGGGGERVLVVFLEKEDGGRGSLSSETKLEVTGDKQSGLWVGGDHRARVIRRPPSEARLQ